MASTWRLAQTLVKLRRQLDRTYPKRSKATDGSIGDKAHASRASDHNPWVRDAGVGVVTAIDITHDPAHGVDGMLLSRRLVSDPRVKYVIWNRQIYNAAVSDKWRPYRGADPHDKHVHVSVHSIKRLYDNERDWDLGTV